MINLQEISPLIKAGSKSFYEGNSLLKKGQFKKATASYRRSISDTLKVRRNWTEKVWSERNFIVNHDYNFVYSSIPKVACSSIKASILKLSHVKNKEGIIKTRGMIHKYMQDNFSLARCDHNKAKKILTQGKYFKFIVVRNPWSRLVSAYLNKFVNRLNLKDEFFVKRVIEEVYRQRGLDPNYERGITFRQFLKYIYITNDEDLNAHWKPQYLFLGDTNFDFIGRFETLDKDFKHLSSRLNVSFDLPWSSNKTNYTQVLDKDKDYSNYYALELRQMKISPIYQYFLSA